MKAPRQKLWPFGSRYSAWQPRAHTRHNRHCPKFRASHFPERTPLISGLVQGLQVVCIELCMPRSSPHYYELQKDHPKNFGPVNEKESVAGALFKEVLRRPPVLALSITKGQYTLDTNGYDKQIECEFLQELKDGGNRPPGFWSRNFIDNVQNLATTYRTCILVIWGVTLLRFYLKETCFNTWKNHKARRWILTVAEATGKLAW